MGKSGKVIGGLVLALVLVVGVAVYWVVNNLDSIVAHAIREAGSQAAGVPVDVSGVSISLRDGSGEIRGLTIGNPPGFDSDYALKLNTVRIAIDTGSIGSDPIRIRQIAVDGADLIAEINAGAGINLSKISDNLASGGSGKGQTEGGDGPRLVIEQFDFTNPGMTLKTQVSEDKSLKLGDVHVSNIGTGSGGATATQAASQLLAPVLREAVKAARSSAGDMGIEGVKEGAMDKLKDKLGIGK